MQTTAEAEESVPMATVTPAMSEKASAFTIASLMADCDAAANRSSVSTSSTATDSDCVSTTAMSQQHQSAESPNMSPENFTSCTKLSTCTLYIRCTVGHVSLTTHQLSLLPSVGPEMSTGQSAVMRCGWGLKAG